MANTFALNPVDLYGDEPCNYRTSEGRKIYALAIAPLTTKYDGSPRGLKLFIHNLSQKALINGWNKTILDIPLGGIDGEEDSQNLLKHYGLISIHQCRAYATTFLKGENKASQDSNNLKLFLDASLDPDFMMKVLHQGSEYTVRGVEDGATMLRVIISLVGIESTATVSVIRANLRTLPDKMSQVNSNIISFNEFVREQQAELVARGETVDDLPSSLFAAYQTADDEAFARYMGDREGAIEDGTNPKLSAAAIMLVAEAKYKIMVIKGRWNVASKPESRSAEIMALTAAYDNLLAQQAAVRTGAIPSPPTANRNRGTNNTGDWAWKDVVPTGNDPTTKTFRNQEYIYCPHGHQSKWVLAKGHLKGCDNDPKRKGMKPTKQGKTTAELTAANKNLKLMKALLTVVEADDGLDEEYEEENI